MKTIIIILSIILLTNILYGQSGRTRKEIKKSLIEGIDTTLINDGVDFQIGTKVIDSNLILLTSTSNNITTIIDTLNVRGIAYIEYLDFNTDGNADILVDFYANNSDQWLYLFDPSRNKFVKLENFENFPSSIQLKSSPHYFYSYSRAGCADANWVSDLFTIKDFTIIQLGHIEGNGCGADIKTDPQVIEIYKVKDNNEDKMKLVKKLPYLKYIPVFGAKWDFIEKYWNANYRYFR